MTIEHDPERGCPGCPFFYDHDDGWLLHCGADAYANAALDHVSAEPSSVPAPAECPLRRGPVTVRAPQ